MSITQPVYPSILVLVLFADRQEGWAEDKSIAVGYVTLFVNNTNQRRCLEVTKQKVKGLGLLSVVICSYCLTHEVVSFDIRLFLR